MRFAWLGGVIVLAAFAAATGALALLVAACAPLWPRLERWPARRQAAMLFAACVLPLGGGLFTAFAVVLPAYLAFEPRDTAERPGLLLIALAAAGALSLVSAAARALADHRETSRAVAGWLRSATPLPGLPLPAAVVDHPFPLAAVAGVRRPRLLLAREVVHALDADELRAVAAHEAAHVAAGDVARRIVLRAACGALRLPGGARALPRRWERACEGAADALAAESVPPLHLARALVKIAALAPAGSRLTLELPALAAEAPVAARVRALLDHDAPAPRARAPLTRVAAAAMLAAAAWLASLPVVLPFVHGWIEAAVRR